MMRKTLLVLLSLSGLAMNSFSQQDVQFSQNQFTKQFYNPAYVAIGSTLCGTLIGRQQWAGFSGAPQTGLLSVKSPLSVIKSGIPGSAGLNVLSDALGNERTLGVNLALGYALNPGAVGPGTLAFGLSAGIINKRFINNWVSVDDKFVDPSIPNDAASSTKFDLNLGIYYDHNDFFVGISVAHLIPATLSDQGSTQVAATPPAQGTVNQQWSLNYGLKQHMYLMAGYNYTLTGNPDFQLRPMILAKTEGSSTQFDLNCNVYYKQQIWGGLSYRLSDAVVVTAGYEFQPLGLRVGYAYDITTSELRRNSGGSHEIALNYCIKIPKKIIRHIYKNVRYL